MNRRSVIAGAAGAAGIAAAAAGWGFLRMGGMEHYERAAASLRATTIGSQLIDVIRYGTLSANSHNTQPWRFRLSDRAIAMRPDFSRRTPAVDPDDHHLFVSLGCAAENIVHAALAAGHSAEPQIDTSGEVSIALQPTAARDSELFRAIPLRQCTRTDFDSREVPAADLASLAKEATAGDVEILLVTDRAEMEKILEQIIVANGAQMGDVAFVNELKSWLRFNVRSALAKGDGLFSGCSGNPQLPDWLAGTAFSLFFSEQAENDKIVRHVRSSAGFAIFHSPGLKADWFDAGRCYQRFALLATALGIRNAHLNQPVEVAQSRQQLASTLGLAGRRLDLVVRFGYGNPMPMSLRRDVSAVIVV